METMWKSNDKRQIKERRKDVLKRMRKKGEIKEWAKNISCLNEWKKADNNERRKDWFNKTKLNNKNG